MDLDNTNQDSNNKNLSNNKNTKNINNKNLHKIKDENESENSDDEIKNSYTINDIQNTNNKNKKIEKHNANKNNSPTQIIENKRKNTMLNKVLDEENQTDSPIYYNTKRRQTVLGNSGIILNKSDQGISINSKFTSLKHSRRFTTFLNKQNNNLTVYSGNNTKIDNPEEFYKKSMDKLENQLSNGITLINKDIDLQNENFKKKLKEKKNKMVKYRKISEDNRLFNINIRNINHTAFSTKHGYDSHRRNFSNLSLTKRFDEDDDYNLSNSNTERNSNFNIKLDDYDGIIGNKSKTNNEGLRKSLKNGEYINLSEIKTNNGQNYLDKRTSFEKYHYSNKFSYYNKKSKPKKNKNNNKKKVLFDETLDKIVINLKSKIKDDLKGKYALLIRELNEEFEAKIEKCKDGLEPYLEFEVLLQNAEGNFFYYLINIKFHYQINRNYI